MTTLKMIAIVTASLVALVAVPAEIAHSAPLGRCQTQEPTVPLSRCCCEPGCPADACPAKVCKPCLGELVGPATLELITPAATGLQGLHQTPVQFQLTSMSDVRVNYPSVWGDDTFVVPANLVGAVFQVEPIDGGSLSLAQSEMAYRIVSIQGEVGEMVFPGGEMVFPGNVLTGENIFSLDESETSVMRVMGASGVVPMSVNAYGLLTNGRYGDTAPAQVNVVCSGTYDHDAGQATLSPCAAGVYAPKPVGGVAIGVVALLAGRALVERLDSGLNHALLAGAIAAACLALAVGWSRRFGTGRR